jgi:H+/gluconate symporter-like permease
MGSPQALSVFLTIMKWVLLIGGILAIVSILVFSLFVLFCKSHHKTIEELQYEDREQAEYLNKVQAEKEAKRHKKI